MFLVWGVICSQDKMENVSFRAIWYQQQQRQQQQASSSRQRVLSGTWVQIHFIYLNIYNYICMGVSLYGGCSKQPLKGFYKLFSSIAHCEKYPDMRKFSLGGAAVWIPITRALGTTLGSTYLGSSSMGPAAAGQQQQAQQQQQHQDLLFGLFFETLVFEEHHHNQEYIRLGLFFETLVFDEHHRNKELKNIFYLVDFLTPWFLTNITATKNSKISSMFLVWGVICSQDKMENVSFRAIWYQRQQRQRQQQQEQEQASSRRPAAAGQQQQASSSSRPAAAASSSSRPAAAAAPRSSIWFVF